METTPIMPEGTAATPRPKPLVALILIIGAALVIGLAFAWSVHVSPLAFRGVTLFEGDYMAGRVVSFGWTGLMEKNLKADSALGDYARGGEVRAVIVENPDTGGQDVVMTKPEQKALTADSTRKAALSISLDGAKVAYAAMTNPPEGVTFTPMMSAWSVRVLDLTSGESWDLGTGFAPQFFVRDGKEYLLFTTPLGVTVADVAAKTGQTTFFLNPGLIDYVAHVSPDGMHLSMPNSLVLKTDVFSVDRVEAPIGLTRLGTTEAALVSSAFVGGALYGVERTDGGARVLKYDLGNLGAAPVSFDLPADSLYRVIP